MEINDKAVEKVAQWLGMLAAFGSGGPPWAKVANIAARFLLIYVTLPQYQRAIVDKALISSACWAHGIPITPYDAEQVFRFLRDKRAIDEGNRIPYTVRHAIASMA